jgi:opacity protein-like surface antigen|tara:strand:+ start:234559 stop:235062 length:504 start_codon:yes stop_codon:yes gene_type:complete
MKKTVVSMMFILGLFFTAQAQEDTRIGAFLAYGTEIENIGVGANAEFPVVENLTISPSLIYYFPKDEFGIKINWLEVNANANYYFVSNESMGVYALGGLNYSSVKISYDGDSIFGESYSASDGRFGLNLGGGINIETGGSIVPFAELKYVLIDGGQLVAGAGVKFNI